MNLKFSRVAKEICQTMKYSRNGARMDLSEHFVGLKSQPPDQLESPKVNGQADNHGLIE